MPVIKEVNNFNLSALSNDEEEMCHIGELPNELMVLFYFIYTRIYWIIFKGLILRYLNIRERLRAERVSRRWKNIARKWAWIKVTKINREMILFGCKSDRYRKMVLSGEKCFIPGFTIENV